MEPTHDPIFTSGGRFRAEQDDGRLATHERPPTFIAYFRSDGLPLLIISAMGIGAAVDAVVKHTPLAIVMFCAMAVLFGLIIAGEWNSRRKLERDSRLLLMSADLLILLRTTLPLVTVPTEWRLEKVRQIGGWQMKDGMRLRLWLTDGTSIDLLRCDGAELEWLAAVLNTELVRRRELADQAAAHAEVRPA